MTAVYEVSIARESISIVEKSQQ